MNLYRVKEDARVEIADSELPGYCVISIRDGQGAVFRAFRLNKEKEVENADHSSFSLTSEDLSRDLYFKARHLAIIFLLSKTIKVIRAEHTNCIVQCGKHYISFIEEPSGNIRRLGFEPYVDKELFQIMVAHAAAVLRKKRKEASSPEEQVVKKHEKETLKSITAGEHPQLINYAKVPVKL